MKAFEFEYTIEYWHKVVIKAETKDEAYEKFAAGEFEEPEITGSEMSEFEITELDTDEDLV